MHGIQSTSVHVFPDVDAISTALEAYVAKVSKEAIARHGMFTVALSGGSLPKVLGAKLRGNKSIDYSAWHVFFADERCVPHTSEDSNFLLARRELLDHVPVPEAQVYPINPRFVDNPEEAADDYMEKLKNVFAKKNSVKFPCFDLILLGIGPDGHTASLFPDHPLLSEDLEWVAAILDSPKPPPTRITLTLPVLNHAHNVAFVVTGDNKVDAVHQILDEHNNALPASAVKPNGRLSWFLDTAAAGNLSVVPQPFKL